MYCWVAGGIGAGGGFLVGAATSQPALRLGASVGGNCLIAATCFCGIFSHLNSFLPFRISAVGSLMLFKWRLQHILGFGGQLL